MGLRRNRILLSDYFNLEITEFRKNGIQFCGHVVIYLVLLLIWHFGEWLGHGLFFVILWYLLTFVHKTLSSLFADFNWYFRFLTAFLRLYDLDVFIFRQASSLVSIFVAGSWHASEIKFTLYVKWKGTLKFMKSSYSCLLMTSKYHSTSKSILTFWDTTSNRKRHHQSPHCFAQKSDSFCFRQTGDAFCLLQTLTLQISELPHILKLSSSHHHSLDFLKFKKSKEWNLK